VADERNTSDDGLDRGRLETWFRESVAGAEPPLTYERITGGRSNLTFRVADSDGGRWILRRPPLGARLGSAHDMGREHRILTGLEGTEVPAPRPVAMCTDESVTGAEFYVMELVDGLVLRDEDEVRAAFEEPDRRKIGDALVDTLADLHAVDPDAAGLGELGRRDGYAERQLKRWMRQWEASKTRELDTMEETHRLLSARVPAQASTSIVHGDYRLDNVIVAADDPGRVRAVLDWEMATLGDPLADLALFTLYWQGWGAPDNPIFATPADHGFPSAAELSRRYAEATGLDLTDDAWAFDGWYAAFACFKFAVICEGIHYRHSHGLTVGEGFDRIGGLVPGIVQRGLSALDR